MQKEILKMVEISIVVTLISLVVLVVALIGRYVEMKQEPRQLDKRDT